MTFVYWLWSSGGLSHFHRTHPDHPRVTWCGALTGTARGTGVAEVYHTDTAPAEVEMCTECERMPRPIRMQGWESKAEVAA